MANERDLLSRLNADDVNLSRQQLGYTKDTNDAIADQVNLVSQLHSQLSNGTKIWSDQVDEIDENVTAAKKLTKEIEKQLEALKKTEGYSSDYADQFKKMQAAQASFEAGREKSLSLENQMSTEAKRLAKDYVDGLTARFKLQDKLDQLAQKELTLEQAKKGIGNVTLADAEKDYLMAAGVVDVLKEKLKTVQQINAGQGDLINHLSEEEKHQLAKFGVLQKQMDVARNYVDNHKDELEILEQQLTPWQKKVSFAIHYINKLKEFPGVSAAIKFANIQLDNIGISFKAILDNVLKLDKALTEFGKNIQVSKDGARAIADGFQSASSKASEYNSNVSAAQATIKAQIEAVDGLNKSLGTSNLYTTQTRMDQIELVKGMGLEAEAAAKLYGLGKLNQQTAHQTAVAIGDQVVNARKSLGVNLDYRKVLNDVAKVSGQIAAQYKNNPEELAKAVVQAQALGLSLEQTANMANKLVDDFAGSLGAELEAELLTGKALNLEQARYLALMGDSAGAAKELMDNVGGITEYQELNVLQQKSLAQAIGLSREELAESLKTQELLKGTTIESADAFKEMAAEAARTGDYTKINAEIARAANGEELAKQASQISNQEKFQMAIEKLQETIANMVNGPFGKLIDGFAKLISNANVLKGIVKTIGAIIAVKIVGGLYDMGKGIAAAIPKLGFLAAEASFMNSMLTLGLGLAAGYAAYKIAESTINSISGGETNISSASGGGVNVPTSTTQTQNNNNTQNIQVYVGPSKMADFNTEGQRGYNTRVN